MLNILSSFFLSLFVVTAYLLTVANLIATSTAFLAQHMSASETTIMVVLWVSVLMVTRATFMLVAGIQRQQ